MQNLRFWPKGVSGNPKGPPPKDTCITSLAKALMEQIPEGERHGRTWAQLQALAWATRSLKDQSSFKELLDRLEGKVPQPVVGESGGPIKIEITVQSEQGRQLVERILDGEGATSKG